MSKKGIQQVHLIAEAAEQVPGFARMMWCAANKLCMARNTIAEMSEYKATHKTARGKQYASLVRREAADSEAFITALDAVSIVLEAANHYKISSSDIQHAVSYEIEEMVNGATWSQAYSRAHGYVDAMSPRF